MNVSRLEDQLANLDMTEQLPFNLLYAGNGCSIVFYKPHPVDLQTPHEQDEYYFVAQGQADIVIADQRSSVFTGDAIFVPALTPHRFEHSSDDFACWAVFLNS